MNFLEKLSRFKLLIATFISVILGVVLGKFWIRTENIMTLINLIACFRISFEEIS